MSLRLSLTAAVALVVWGAGAGVAELRAESSSMELEASEVPAPETYDELRKQGRSAYNAGNYDRAVQYYIEAIQAAPETPKAHLHLARAFFWRKDYAAAVAYYDFYIQMAPSDAPSDKVKSERKLAASRAGDEVWRPSDAQRRILDSLRTRLNEGTAYTEGGGGAWGLYRALLRTDYAHPDLAQIRTRLRTKLLEEFDARTQPASGEPAPKLSLNGWRRQRERLEAARLLADDAALDRIKSRATIVRTGFALLNGRYSEAAEAAARAVQSHPDRTFLKWFHVGALVQSDRYDEAERVLSRYESELGSSEAGRGYLETLRAALAHRRGELDAATDTYYRMLKTR